MAGVLKNRTRIDINDAECIRGLLQELYNEVCKNIEEVQTQMNRLASSTNLNDEILDSRTKYAKAMNDFISSKAKAVAQKIDIARLLSEIYKHNGDVRDALENGTGAPGAFDARSLQKMLRMEEERNSENNVRTYNIT